ncbi:MAG: DNA-binding response regulator [Chloroflexota bacterium]|nr:response regulator transcription factor [Ardenticatenaceae bacterium]GIK56660.1 MAG: DNA-binding response regulator [Chloroflexota bacterium]
MAQTILVVDDEIRLRDMLRVYLEKEGYRVVEAGNGREAHVVACYEKPDLIILDLMMPELGGYDFIRAYRKEAETPVIMLTAKIEETDKVIGLELGADDYVTKPFGISELIARVRAVLRRVSKQDAASDILRVADIVLDRAGRVVQVRGKPVDLTPSEFEILAALMATPGRAFSRLDLLERTSGDAYEGYERTIDVHIRNLRAKIEANPGNPQYVQTVYGMGYRFVNE